MKISNVRSKDGFTYAMIDPLDGRPQLCRVQRTTGLVQVEAYDRRRGRFWRRIRSGLAEAIRLGIAETQRQDRLEEAVAQSSGAPKTAVRGG